MNSHIYVKLSLNLTDLASRLIALSCTCTTMFYTNITSYIAYNFKLLKSIWT